MEILNLISKAQSYFEKKSIAETSSKEKETTSKLSEDNPNEDMLKYIESSNSLSYEELEEIILKEEFKNLSNQIITELTSMFSDGKITQENFDEINKILSEGMSLDGIKKMQKILSNLEEPSIEKTYNNTADIEKALGELDQESYKAVMNKVENVSSIKKLEISSTGSYKISTADNSSILLSKAGTIVHSYDNDYKTGFDVYDEQDRLQSSIYVDHKKNDTTVVENYEHNEDGSYKETIDTSAEPETQKIVSVDQNSNITNVEIKNKTTGEITQDETFAQTMNSTVIGGANANPATAISSDGPTNADIASDEAELAALQAEQTATQEDLTEQEASYDQTNAEKEQEVGAIDGKIETEQGNLDTANAEQDVAQGEVDTATAECEEAQANVDTAQGEADETEAALNDATNATAEAQEAQETAADNQAQAVSEEQAAQGESNTANENLSTATDATNAASSAKQASGADLSAAVTKTNSAFNVKTQKDQAVKDAERAYKSAEAEKNAKEKNLIDYLCDAWNWVCEKVSQAWNALTNAKNEQKEAVEDYKNKKTDEDKKRVIDEKAEAELKKRQDEQDTAQSVADAAKVVLDAKTGAREVSDEELANALMDLADAMMVQEGAETDHDGALDALMLANGYKADADGNLVDAQGNLVSCQEIVAGLETMISGLSTERSNTEASYNQVLTTTAAVIQGDQQKIQSLGTEIEALQKNITQKKAELALQEEMVTRLATERGDMNAYGTPESEDEYWSDRKVLEEAIMSGDPKQIEKAYKELFGDNDVMVDASGKVVDPSSLSEEELAKCTTKKVSELSGEQLTSKVDLDKTAALESSQMAELLADGGFCVDGQPLSQEELNEALIKQAEEQIAELEKAMNEQGIISKGVGGLNNLIGIGTTGNDAKYEVERYKRLVEQLKTCKNPTQYAALYKEVTGNNFSANEVIQLAAYRKANNMPASPTTSKAPQVPAENKVDLGEYVDQTLEACKGEDGKVNTSYLSKTGNSKGAEAIADYKETQKNIVEGAKGVVVGVVSAVVAVAAVAATPFTGGASLVALAVVGAAVGAGTNIALGAIDSVYDGDGDGSIDFNYSLDDLKHDAITGAITGSVSAVTSGVGDKVTGAITSKASGAIATTGKEAFKQGATKFVGKVAGEAAEGAIDGALSAGADYTYRATQDGTFSFGGLVKATGQGGAMGGVVGGGMGAAGELFTGTKHFIDGKIMQGKVDDILTMGGTKHVIDIDENVSVIDYKANLDAGTGLAKTDDIIPVEDLKLETIIANNLDPKYIKDGKVNQWSITQITQDAKNAQKALSKAGLGDNTMAVLNNVTTDNYAKIPKVTEALTDKTNMAALGLAGADGNIDVDKASNFISGIDEIKTRPDGSLEQVTAYGQNGQKVALDFDSNGKVTNVGIVDDAAGGKDNGIKLLDDNSGTSDVGTNYKDDYVVVSDGDVIGKDGTITSGGSTKVTDADGGTTVTDSGTKVTDGGTSSSGTTATPREDLNKYINADSSPKTPTVSENAKEFIADKAEEYYQDEISKLIEKQQKGLLPWNADIQAIAKENTNNYIEHLEFYFGRRDLFDGVSTNPDMKWAQYTPDDQHHGAWKMHVFAGSEADWQNIADKIIPYLKDNDIDWKTSLDLDFSDANQKGKAFAIYPKNSDDMAKIAKDLDYIIRGNDLTVNGSKIIGDNNLGDSGRLFYRYEFKSGKDKDLILDLGDDATYKDYRYNYYEPNRGSGRYLADDMTPDDDIWANFDPADPNSTYKGGTTTVVDSTIADTSFKPSNITKDNIQENWSKLTNEQKTTWVQDLKNPDGTARFTNPDVIDDITYYLDESPLEVATILEMKNPDGTYRFTSALDVDILSRQMAEYPDEVMRLLDLKNIDGSPRIKSAYAVNDMAYALKEYGSIMDNLIETKNPDGTYMFDLNAYESVKDMKTRAKSIVYANSGANNPPIQYNIKDLSHKIKELKKSGYLTANIDIKNISKNPGMLDNELLRDIDKMYSAMQKGISVEDAFVPKFTNVTSAAQTLGTGDICRIGNSNKVAIKLSDGTIEELNMSYEKYLELFPPVSEYISGQQQIGDCYLVSSIDQLYKTPETKANVLRSFTENADGSVTVQLPNGNVKFTLAPGTKVDDYVIKEMQTAEGIKKGNFVMSASEGYKALEYTYGLELVQQQADYIDWQIKYDPNLSEADRVNLTQALINYSDPNFVNTFGTQLRNQGGWKNNVFEIFGLTPRAEKYELINSARDVLTDPDAWNKYIIGGGTKGDADTHFLNSNMKIAARHAYSIEPFVADDLGSIMYKVTNPWHGTNNVILTPEELEEYFLTFYIAEKP